MRDLPWTAPDEIKALLDASECVTFIDARRVPRYDASDHQLPGAIRVAPSEVTHIVGQVPCGIVMVVYGDGDCDGPEVDVAQVLDDYGYPQVALLEGGFDEWDQRGYPTECKVAMGIGPGA